MKSYATKLLLILALLAALSWGVYQCRYQYSYEADLAARPWAYNRDAAAKLLVGTWQGEFRDPDGVPKTIRLTIVEPTTEAEREKKASRRSRRRKGLGSQTDQRRFDGTATVTSKLGQEDYEVWGSVGENNWHRLRTTYFRVVDERRQLRKNFGLREAEGGTWQDDRLTLTLGFSYTTASGSGYSSSADPRFDRQISVQLFRRNP